MVVTALFIAAGVVAVNVQVQNASATDGTVSYDNLRTGWDPNEPSLSPADASASDFGQLFATQLDGQIYAQPIVADGVVLAVTENDKAYGLDPQTGAIIWSRDVGPTWPASAIGCGDLVPNVGSTATPVVDTATNTAYFTTKVNDGPTVNNPHWYMHAIDITTGVERAGFPTTIAGTPSNDPVHAFNPKTAMQRPGLLLLGGVVYAGFASHCDYKPYVGYVVGVNAATGKLATMWSTEAGSAKSEAGIWQSGGGIVSDGPGTMIVATGNGLSPAPGPGNQPPPNLAESVVRLKVNPDGTLSATDFFSPHNNTNLDTDDLDLGSGGPLAIPDGYGTTAHPHLLVQVGKDGRVFLLDRDHLGGDAQGAGGTDAALQIVGPYRGVWGHPAFWGGNGGYVYDVENAGYLRAYKVGTAGSGLPSLTSVGTSAGTFGYTSGSPVITSTGTTSGSALVWVEYSTGSTGANAQLRAYNPIPVNGVLQLVYSVPIGNASKFAVPATDNGRLYLGTRDGVLFGFGRPAHSALTAPPTDLGSVDVGGTSTGQVTVTATQSVTVDSVSTATPFAVGTTTLPVTLTTGQHLTVPVSFSPTTSGAQSGSITFETSAGELSFELNGNGTSPGLVADPTTLDFGEVPTGGVSTASVSITNSGASNETVTAATGPSSPYAASSLPATGLVLAPSASVSVPISFQPTASGDFDDTLVVTSDAGSVTVPISGTGVTGAPQLTITPLTTDFGAVPIGQSLTKTFDIANTGNLTLTITKAAPPAGPFGATTPISEGQQLTPGEVVQQAITFTPTAVGAATGAYLITGNDGQGEQTVSFTGSGVAAGGNPLPAPASPAWTYNGAAKQTGGDTVLTPAKANVAGSAIYATPVRTDGLHAHFTAQLSGGTGADGLTFELLDPATATATALGRTGGALGYGGLTGVAVTLDTYQNGDDPSGNFVGIVTAATGTKKDVLTYAASMPAPTSLRTGTHSVDVTVTGSQLQVSLDGGPALTATVALPSQALIGFSAATGGKTDVHTVRSVSITTAGTSATAIAYRAAAHSYAAAATSTATVTTPTTVAAGDTEVLYVSTSVVGAASGPPGWTRVAQQSSAPLQATVYSRIATSTDAGSAVSVPITARSAVALQLVAYSGSVSSVTATAAGDSNQSAHATPTATVSGTGAWVVSFWADKSSSTTAWTVPVGLTTRDTVTATGSGRVTDTVADSAAAVATGTTARQTATVTGGVSGKAAMFTVVLAP